MGVLEMFLEDRSIVLYRPQVNRILKFGEATILLSQVAYWWKKMGRKRFYKFKEPCDHVDCREGESWTEELGITRYAFDKAVKILQEYEILRIEYDRLSHRTYYDIDWLNLETFLEIAYTADTDANGDGQLSGKSKVSDGESSPSTFAKVEGQLSYNYTETTIEGTEKRKKLFQKVLEGMGDSPMAATLKAKYSKLL